MITQVPVRMSKEARSPEPFPIYTVFPSISSEIAVMEVSLKSIDITGLL